MSVICRKATIADVDALHDLIQGYAVQGIMLPRSHESLARTIGNFVVAVDMDKSKLIGCGSLLKLGADLVEIRSLGMADGYKGQGVGSKIVNLLMENAKEQRIPKVMALTYEVNFFLKNGFHVVEKEIFPEKVWTDCVNCPKQNNCDEIAVLKLIEVAPEVEVDSEAKTYA